MPKTKTANSSAANAMIGIRLTADERKRYNELLRKVKQKYKYISKSDINRELFGMAPNVALTDADIRYFKTGEK